MVSKIGSEFLVNTTTAEMQGISSVAALRTGGFVVTWTDASQTDGDTNGNAVRGQMFDARGNKVGSEFLVNTTTAGSQGLPSVAALSTGGFVVTWEDSSQTDGDTSGYAVRGQVFDASGAKVGTEFLVNTTTAGDQELSSVAALSTGGFVVTWTDRSQSDGDTSDSAVRGQMFDASGNKVGSEFLVNTSTASYQGLPSVASLSDGGFVVTWTDNSHTDGDTSLEAVRGQIFNASVNTAPTAVDDRWLVSRNTAVTAAASVLTANDSDPEGNSLTVTAVSNPVNATVSLNKGEITFTTSAESSSFQYTVSDGQGGTANATVQVSSVATGNGADTVDASNYTFAFLEGGNGDDRLTGSPGDDVLSGGNGDDVLTGGGGRDTLTGGNGADTFRYTSPQEGGDTITDFKVSTDRLQIYSPNFGNLTPAAGGTLAAENFTANAEGTATRASDRFVFNTTTGLLSYDSDGTGPAQAVAIATLRNGSNSVTTLSERDIALFTTTS